MTQAARYYLSPALTLFDSSQIESAIPSWESEIQYADELAARESEHLYWQNRITPQIAADTVAISKQYPWLSPGVATGAAFAGIGVEDPALKWLADREAEQADHGGLFSVIGDVLGMPFTLFKGSTRLATTGFDMLWEEGLSRPLRTTVGVQQGLDSGEAYSRAGASIGTRAIGEAFGGEGDLNAGERLEAFVRNVTPLPSLAGQGVNLGSGYLPKSNVASDTDRQVQALTELLTQQGIPAERAQAQAIQSVQQSYGRPVSQEARAQAETGITIGDKYGKRVAISPGRLAAVGLGMASDTTAFNVVSGIGDFSAQIFLDPSNIALAGLSKARLASRLLTNGNRSGRVFGQNVGKFTEGAFYNESLIPRLTQMDSMLDIKNALGLRAGANSSEIGSVRRLIADLRDSKNATRTREVLEPHLGSTIRKSPQPENVLTMMRGKGKTVGQRVGSTDAFYRMLGSGKDEAARLAAQGETFGLKVGVKHRLEGTTLGRLFSETSDRMLDTEDMDAAWFGLDRFLNNAGFSAEAQDDLLHRFAMLGDADQTGAFQVMKSAMGEFEKSIVDGLIAKGEATDIAQKWAHSFTRMYDSQEEWVKYWTSQSGNPAYFPSGHFKAVANGEVHMVEAKPTVHLISEMVSRQLPLPEPREMRRLMSEISAIPISKLTARRGLKHGKDATFEANVMTNMTDFYMQKVWKPMVLLRFAWPVRVIGEEQFRSAAAGKYSAISHPLQWLAFATGQKGNRTLLRQLPSPSEVNRALKKGAHGEMVDLPKGLDEFYSGLAASHGGWINTKGQMMSVAGYSTRSVGDPGFTDALVWNIGKLNANDTITKRLRADGIDATAKWLHSGSGQRVLRKLKDAQDAQKLGTYQDVHRYLQSVDARINVTAGGGYVWWDEVALKWRDHFDQFVDELEAPPPPSGFDPTQPAFEGMAAQRHSTLKTDASPGLGDPSFRKPGYGKQGRFDTDFQPRVQREMQGDYRIIDHWLHGGPEPALSPTQVDTAYSTGRTPGVFGDSVPLDRQWGQYSGTSDYELTNRLVQSMGDWSGYSEFENLSHVDETMDIVFQELLMRHGSTYTQEGRSNLLAAFGSGRDSTSYGGARARSLEETGELVASQARNQQRTDLLDLVTQYEQLHSIESFYKDLQRVAGKTPSQPLRALSSNTDSPLISSAVLDDTTAGEIAFLTAIQDQLASAPDGAGLQYIDQVIDDAVEMSARAFPQDAMMADGIVSHGRPWAQEIGENVKRSMRQQRGMHDHADEWDAVVRPTTADDFVDFRDRSIAGAFGLEDDAVTAKPSYVTVYADGDNFGRATSDVVVKSSDIPTAYANPRKLTISLGGPVPEFQMSDLIDTYTAKYGADLPKDTDTLSAYALNVYREKSANLGAAIETRGFKINMDDDAIQWLTHEGIQGVDDAGGWRVPWNQIADENAVGIKSRPMIDLGAALEGELDSVRNVDETFFNLALEGDQKAADDLLLAAQETRDSLVRERRQILEETVNTTGYSMAQDLNGGTYGGKSTDSLVSEVLQYGQVWKESTLHQGDAAIAWSSEMDSVSKELLTRRVSALSRGKIDEFDDQVLDSIFNIADNLGISPSVIMDEFDQAFYDATKLSQANIDISSAAFRSPMGRPVLPNTIADEMDSAVYAMSDVPRAERAAAWDELADDAPVHVYAWVSGDEAHKLATEGWDGGPLLVSTNPEIAAYYSVPLAPAGGGLPALGHGRIGPPLEGILEGGMGSSSGNLVGPGLYSTSHGGVLGGGYAGGGFGAGESVTQINWVGKGEPRIFDINAAPLSQPDEWRAIRSEIRRMRDDPPDEVMNADGFQDWIDGIDDLLLDIRDTITPVDGKYRADPDGWTMYSRLLGHTDASNIAANEAVSRLGYDAISHVGGAFATNTKDKHRVYVWLWKTLNDGNIEGSGVNRTVTQGSVARRAVGREENANKLVAMRVNKADVTPSYKALPSQTDGDALAEFGLGGQISRNLDPEEVRFVSHTGSDIDIAPVGQPHKVRSHGPDQGVTPITGSRNATPALDLVDEATLAALDEARAAGLRVQYYTAADGKGVAISVSGADEQFLEATIGVTDRINYLSSHTQEGVVTGDISDIPRILGDIKPPKSTRALFTSADRTSSNVVGNIKALHDLPDAEAALLRQALDDMPAPRDQLADIRNTDVPHQDIPPPDIGPPSPMDMPIEDTPVDLWYHKTGEADDGLLNLIYERKHTIGEGDDATEIRLPSELESMPDELKAYIQGLADEGRTPEKVPYRNLEVDEERGGMLDSALSIAFYHMMSKPTNFLSRAPAWKQSYIQRVLELRSFAVPKVQKQIDDLLYKSTADGGFGITQSNARHILGRTPIEVGDHGGTIAKMRTVDDLAKAFALEETKDLLYDATKRHNITDITRNIFPFAEAWAEVIGVWSRIMFEHPETLRRAQQGLEGARDSGFFFENENGDEVFAYPGLDMVGNWMLGQDTSQGAGVQFTGRTSGLNIALGGFLPGFGPTVQLPVSMAADHMPIGWDWVKDMVLPFGAAELDYTPGDLLNAGLPSWYRRFLGAVGAGDGKYQQQYFNGVIDTFKLKTLDDSRLLNDPNLAAAALDDSFGDARMIGLLRTAAQFILPTGPQVTYKAGDIDGKNWTMQALASEYYAILARNDYDSFEAYREFQMRFGYDPTTFTTAKSVRVVKMSTTKSGDDWFRENEDLFENNAYPTTAAYAMPDLPWDEFDYGAYNRQLEEDARQGVTPEVWTMRRNQLLGNIQFENAKAIINDRTDPAAKQWLRQIRTNLRDEYPGFDLQQIPGVPGRATIDQKILELEKWGADPRLSGSATGKGLSVYLEIRNQAQIRAMEHGFSPTAFQTANSMEYIREWMRSQAASIMAQYPDFSTLWFDVFARELEEVNAPTEPLSLSGMSFKESA